jgi:hypothetical protein
MAARFRERLAPVLESLERESRTLRDRLRRWAVRQVLLGPDYATPGISQFPSTSRPHDGAPCYPGLVYIHLRG